jgi:hypothetical protein
MHDASIMRTPVLHRRDNTPQAGTRAGVDEARNGTPKSLPPRDLIRNGRMRFP